MELRWGCMRILCCILAGVDIADSLFIGVGALLALTAIVQLELLDDVIRLRNNNQADILVNVLIGILLLICVCKTILASTLLAGTVKGHRTKCRVWLIGNALIALVSSALVSFAPVSFVPVFFALVSFAPVFFALSWYIRSRWYIILLHFGVEILRTMVVGMFLDELGSRKSSRPPVLRKSNLLETNRSGIDKEEELLKQQASSEV